MRSINSTISAYAGRAAEASEEASLSASERMLLVGGIGIAGTAALGRLCLSILTDPHANPTLSIPDGLHEIGPAHITRTFTACELYDIERHDANDSVRYRKRRMTSFEMMVTWADLQDGALAGLLDTDRKQYAVMTRLLHIADGEQKIGERTIRSPGVRECKALLAACRRAEGSQTMRENGIIKLVAGLDAGAEAVLELLADNNIGGELKTRIGLLAAEFCGSELVLSRLAASGIDSPVTNRIRLCNAQAPFDGVTALLSTCRKPTAEPGATTLAEANVALASGGRNAAVGDRFIHNNLNLMSTRDLFTTLNSPIGRQRISPVAQSIMQSLEDHPLREPKAFGAKR